MLPFAKCSNFKFDLKISRLNQLDTFFFPLFVYLDSTYDYQNRFCINEYLGNWGQNQWNHTLCFVVVVNDIGFLYMCVRKPRNQICVRSRVNSAVALQSNWNDGHETNERRTTIVRKIEVVVVNLLDMNSGHKNIAEVSDFYCFTYVHNF